MGIIAQSWLPDFGLKWLLDQQFFQIVINQANLTKALLLPFLKEKPREVSL